MVRPRRSAALYRRIWTDQGSPLLYIAERQAAGLQTALDVHYPGFTTVLVGMRYGKPSIAEGLRHLREMGITRILIFPLFPQYSATTTASTFDAVFNELKGWRWMPELRTISHYYDHPAYIAALANSIQESWDKTDPPQKLLFSFHGMPERYARAGDPYPQQCHKTAGLVAERLALNDGVWRVAFQSRFGPEEWLQPYTDELLVEWGRAGVKSVQVICPGFSSDCLETIDEIGHEGLELFTGQGGKSFNYIPALNDSSNHINALAEIILPHLAGWLPQTEMQDKVPNALPEFNVSITQTTSD